MYHFYSKIYIWYINNIKLDKYYKYIFDSIYLYKSIKNIKIAKDG